MVHHSDRGIQYASHEYVAVLNAHKVIPSMSKPANPYDNAICESFMKTLKQEEIYCESYRDLDDLERHAGEFIERYYNELRLHSALGYRPPVEFEEAATGPGLVEGPKMSFFRHGKSIAPILDSAGNESTSPPPESS